MAQITHPAFGDRPIQYSVAAVSDDPDEQVAQVIGMMRDYVRADARSPEILREVARMRAAGQPALDPLDATYIYVREQLQFRTDDQTAGPLGEMRWPIVETLTRPRDMAVMCESGTCSRGGDCDDYAMFAAALLTAQGIPCSFVTIAADPKDPRAWSHVYVAAYPRPDIRIPLDCSHGQYLGWESPVRFRIQEWPIAGLGLGFISSLAAGFTLWWLLKGKGGLS